MSLQGGLNTKIIEGGLVGSGAVFHVVGRSSKLKAGCNFIGEMRKGEFQVKYFFFKKNAVLKIFKILV